MHLPGLFAHPKPAKPTRFFAIHIAEKYVEAALWEVADNAVHTLATSEQHTWSTDDNCVIAIDASLQELGKEAEEVKQALFSLRTDWVNARGILPAKKTLFQRVTKELSLEAIGFVVTTEAFIQHLTQANTPQLSLFLIDVSETDLFVSLVKNGQITKTEKVGRSGDPVGDLTEAFARFTEKVFPAKFVLFSTLLTGEELAEIQQQFLQKNWTEGFAFLHPPLIDTTHPDNVLEIIISTGGKAVAEARGLLQKKADRTIEEPVPSTDVESAATPPILSGDNFGFSEVIQHQEPTETVHNERIEEDLAVLPTKKISHLPFILAGVFFGLVILAAAILLLAGQLIHASIVLQLNQKPVNKEATLTLDPKAQQSDPAKLLLKATIVTQSEHGQKSAAATGTKLIGDKAKGTVTLFNLTNSSKSFPAGTVIHKNTFKYTFDQAVTVASSSSSQDQSTNAITIKPGTANVAVTASVLGADSNTDKSTDFTVDGYDSKALTARSDAGLSGGTSRQIQAVSQDDVDKLLAAAKADLIAKAAQDFKAGNGGGKFVIPTGRVKVGKATYSAEVGKETNTFSVDLQADVEGISYQQADFKPIATQILAGETPSGFQLSSDDPQILTEPIQAASGSANRSATSTMKISLSTVATPIIDQAAIKQSLIGLTIPSATEKLLSQQGIKNATITLSPKILTILFHTLPKKIDHIDITVQ